MIFAVWINGLILTELERNARRRSTDFGSGLVRKSRKQKVESRKKPEGKLTKGQRDQGTTRQENGAKGGGTLNVELRTSNFESLSLGLRLGMGFNARGKDAEVQRGKKRTR